MSEAFLRFWGVRGSYAAPHDTHLGVGGNTSCVELRWDDTLLVCDGGTGIISLGEELMKHADLKELMVVFTHYHRRSRLNGAFASSGRAIPRRISRSGCRTR
jgi:phosphoribosyl 1,2-cyclic phosphodiesterase